MSNKISIEKISGIEFISDCKYFQRILQEKGYDPTLSEIQELWQEYSESLSASWLSIEEYSEKEIWKSIKEYIRNRNV